jgi:hypothetical protein
MKTADGENPNRWVIGYSNRVYGAAGQNKSCSITWAAKQEKLRLAEMCFFLTSLYRTNQASGITSELPVIRAEAERMTPPSRRRHSQVMLP